MRDRAVGGRAGDICGFEFPFVNDYDIVNKTTFRWDDSYVTNNPAEYRQEISGYDYYRLLGGSHVKEKLGSFVEGVIPTVSKYYRVPLELRAEGKFVCPHSVLEMILCNNMASAGDKAQQVSLMSDMAHISSAYTEMTNQKKGGIGEDMRKLDHRLRFVRRRNEDELFNSDGRDFSRQPGVWDILWQLTCTHSFSTYVAWMKSAESHGPDSVFYNWDDEGDIPRNEWLIDDIF